MPHAVPPKVREAFPCHRPSQSHSRLALGLCVCGLYGEATCTGYLQSGEGGGSFYATEEIKFHEPGGTLPVQRAWWGRVPFQCKCSGSCRRNSPVVAGEQFEWATPLRWYWRRLLSFAPSDPLAFSLPKSHQICAGGDRFQYHGGWVFDLFFIASRGNLLGKIPRFYDPLNFHPHSRKLAWDSYHMKNYGVHFPSLSWELGAVISNQLPSTFQVIFMCSRGSLKHPFRKLGVFFLRSRKFRQADKAQWNCQFLLMALESCCEVNLWTLIFFSARG